MTAASQASREAAAGVTARVLDPLVRRVLPRGLAPQLSRYTIVSALALGLDFAVLLALTQGFGLRASLAGLVGYGAGLVLHFALSTRFVFNATPTDKSRARLFGEFVASGVVGLVITGTILWLATDIAGLPTICGKTAAVAISFYTVFMLRRSVVFAGRRDAFTSAAAAPSRGRRI